MLERTRGGAGAYAPWVVVKFHDHVELPYEDGIEALLQELGIGPWDRLAAEFPGIRLRRLFTTLSPEELRSLVQRAERLDRDYRAPNFLTYFAIDCPPGVDPEALAEALSSWRTVETAYVAAGPTPPPVFPDDDDYFLNQGYLGAAPAGIDARYAWGFAGGDGAGIGFVDMERGWTLKHEDLAAANIVLLSGDNRDFCGHGAAVLGVVVAVDNNIGCVGIVPKATARVISQFRTQTDPNPKNADAIASAAAVMQFGDVLLLEAQVNWLPVELESGTFDAIRLATALGAVVVEAAGNGGKNLDGLISNDSGAILVAAATSTFPHKRCCDTNFGSRVDCFGWGDNIVTTGDGWLGNDVDAYTCTNSIPCTDCTSGEIPCSFGGTSGAAAIVAGAAVAVQGLNQASRGYRLSPSQMRELLKEPGNSTPSADPKPPGPVVPGKVYDMIGVMPNLKAILGRNALGLAPDVYLRDFVGDTGDPHTGPLSMSPDVILRQTDVANPQASFGVGSGTENDDMLSEDARKGQDNFLYVRVRNRGGSAASSVDCTVYWSPVATLVTPDKWTPIGSDTIANVPPNVLTVSGPIVWPSAEIPATGHYCFVALVGNASDPAPSRGDLRNWDNFLRFVRDNNSVAWRNFNVTINPLLNELMELSFLVTGAPADGLVMELEVIAGLPEGARALLEAPLHLLDALGTVGPHAEIDGERRAGRLPVAAQGRQRLGEGFLSAGYSARCRLLVQIPRESRELPFEIAVRQLFEGFEVGRVTWRLVPSRTMEEGRRRRNDVAR